jgi:hypothetical protein|tara:strand:+ start:2193 stop:2333 length:141 start_codon:yes stop_codon:yes gene_type:complete
MSKYYSPHKLHIEGFSVEECPEELYGGKRNREEVGTQNDDFQLQKQ